MKDLSDLARIASDLPRALQQAQVAGVRKASLAVTRGIRQEIRVATGGDMRLSGVGRRGAALNARYDVKGQTNPTAIIRATGPAQLVEHNTRPHQITPRKRRKTRALRFADGSFARSASHPGTKAKRPYERGYLKTRDQTGPLFDVEVQKAIRKALSR